MIEDGTFNEDRDLDEEARANHALAPPPVFSRTMTDASGVEVTLDLLPRMLFQRLGWQVGVRISTALPDGAGAIAGTIGLSDEDRWAFIEALGGQSA